MSELTLERVIKKKSSVALTVELQNVYILVHFCFILIKGLLSIM